jgi:hypothetical protein
LDIRWLFFGFLEWERLSVQLGDSSTHGEQSTPNNQ